MQSASLAGLDPTLIRNLTDHQGNNLLHTVCSFGHLGVLPWLVRRLAAQVGPGGALEDENRRGVTPVVAAIKVKLLADARHGRGMRRRD